MAKQLGALPSDLVHLTDPYRAFCFNETLAWYESFIQEQVDKVEHDDPKIQQSRRTMKLKQLLGLATKAQGFRNPATS